MHHPKKNPHNVGYKSLYFLFLILISGLYLSPRLIAQNTPPNPQTESIPKKPFTLQDIMIFCSIHDAVISDDGKWTAYQVLPQRGNSQVIVQHNTTGQTGTIPRGGKPVFSNNSRWLAASLSPDILELEKQNPNTNSKPLQGMAIVDTNSGMTYLIEKVTKFNFSRNSQWLIYQHYPKYYTHTSNGSEENDTDNMKPLEQVVHQKWQNRS